MSHDARRNGHQKAGKKKLLPESSDNVQVFCRIRPCPGNADRCLRRMDKKTIQLTPPTAAVRNGIVKEMQYKFAFAFDEDATQGDIFENVGLPLVCDLVQGKNGILFTYGITSSGKTYTMEGGYKEPGVLPRALDVLFNSIQNVLAPRGTFKPDGFNGFDVQSDMDALVARQRRDRDAEKTGRGKGKDDDAKLVSRSMEKGTVDGVDPDCLYSLFISYLEIYNNYAYDLLQVDTDEPGKTTVLQTKLLREDSTNHIYVAGAAEIEVQSANEALRLLGRGQKVRRVASTQLNVDSSRSHAIFNVRLVQAPLDETGTRVVEDKDIIQISLLSLTDLAGSERTKRTDNKGDRLREAGNINSSLLTLRKCLNMLRAIQKGENLGEIVPYRDSKLTHLFKSCFEGEGKVRMIVCLNPSAEEYGETLNVLSFAEAAQEIQVSRSQQVRFDQLGFTPGRRAAAEESKKRKAALDTFETTTKEFTSHRVKQKSFSSDYEVLLTFPNIRLNHHTDNMTLPELARFLTERIARHKALFASLKDQEAVFCSRLRALMSSHHNVQKENFDLRDHLEERNQRISDLERDLAEQIRVRNILMHHSTLSEQAKVELMGQLKDREYALGQEQLKGHKYRSKLKGEARENAERLQREQEIERQLRETRDQYSQKSAELREEHRRLRDFGGDGSSLTPSAPFQSSTTSTLTDSPLSKNEAGFSGHHRDYTRSRQATAGTSQNKQTYSHGIERNYSRSRQVTPGVHPLTQNSTTPFVNPRYGMHGRRSKSHDQCLDHRSKHRTPVGTRLQPVYGMFEKRKSVTKLELADVKKSSTYQLEYQQADSDGNVQTSLIKGDILPTAGGGRSMIITDVETVMQQDPDTLTVERKRKLYEDGGQMIDVLTERIENGRDYNTRQSAKKPSSKASGKRLYPVLPTREN